MRRNVLAYHPTRHVAIKQEIEAEDETGRIHQFKGEAISMSPVFASTTAPMAFIFAPLSFIKARRASMVARTSSAEAVAVEARTPK